MAVARLEGTVVEVKMDPRKNSFRIRIDDGTGTATLSGYGKLASFQKVLKDRFPQVGDRVSAVGNLSVSESWGVTLFLTSPRRMKLLKRKPVETLPLNAVTLDRLGEIGVFTGTIKHIKTFRKGRSLMLSDGAAEIPLVIFDSELSGCSDTVIDALNRTGTTLRFRGRIDRYRNHLQLRLANPSSPDAVTLVEPASHPRPVREDR